MRRWQLFAGLWAAMVLACNLFSPLVPTPDIGQVVAQTMAVYTAEAASTQVMQRLSLARTQIAASSETSAAFTAMPEASAMDLITATATLPPPTPQEIAPDPLPATHTGIILNNGECFNFDDGQVLSSRDAQCDLWLGEDHLFHQVNGARLSGYVTLSPPTRTYCQGGRYEPGDLAIQTDIYYCFITNESRPGFIVVRQYLGGFPPGGIVFDYWTFH